LNSGGSRNLASALDLLRTDVFTTARGNRLSYPDVAIVILNGQSVNPTATLQAAAAVQALGITILAVGVTNNAIQMELEAIASYPSSSNVFTVPDYNSFVNIRSRLIISMCNG
jgi:von Willebrand factor type A domain